MISTEEIAIKHKEFVIGQDDFRIRFEQQIKYKLNRTTRGHDRTEIQIQKLNITKFLRLQTTAEKIYWQSRDKKIEIAGLGKARLIQSQNGIKDFSVVDDFFADESNITENTRYYGGFRFTRNNYKNEHWRSFCGYCFILPRFEIVRKGSNYYFACNLAEEDAGNLNTILSEFDGINFEYWDQDEKIPAVTGRNNYPDYTEWKSHIDEAIGLIEKGVLEKIVLARKTAFQFTEKLNPFNILKNLQEISKNSVTFGFQFSGKNAFIGATPEILFSRNGRNIRSEAIAGTRPAGDSAREDKQNELELRNSEKDVREHALVVDQIRDNLSPICENLKCDEELSVIKLRKIQHLYVGVKGVLKKDIADSKILEQLHPTPAVGGVPTKKALEYIEKLEPFERGWYAAPVGWVSKNQSEFVVAIRSGLVAENELTLYSGAGIVAGSDPLKEWEEIEKKIGNFLNILNLND